MHKEEASRLFAVLGNPDCVKIVKMLYHNEQFNLEQLSSRMDLTGIELKTHIKNLCDVELILKDNETYRCNRVLVDSLMSFIITKCSCC